ncbi:MAG: sulfotransferase [Actinomycetota bacterium]|nr:sulfotransferase [Actinomycetota bacterium]
MLGAESANTDGGVLPNVVIIGAQKCGTTALHSYMHRHPEVMMSTPKELNFFIDDPRKGNWRRGLVWYRARFDGSFAAHGESSPDYTAHPLYHGVPERMARCVPDAKLIFLVRDPVDRAHAGYVHHYAKGSERRAMREALLDPDSPHLWRSRYHHQLSLWLDHYPLERILVLSQDELRGNRRPTLKSVWRFLGVRENVWRESFRIKRLQTKDLRRLTALGRLVQDRVSGPRWRSLRRYPLFTRPFEPPELDPGLRSQVADLLREDAARFRELTGMAFDEWSV